MADLKTLLGLVAAGHRLTEAEASQAFEIIMSGNGTPAQIGAFLMALRVRGETIDEITGASRVLRAKAAHIDGPEGTIDTCGTGGDAAGTYNISTATALVVAACGVPVAKHGNRAVSSRSGAADVLAALGVNIDCDLALVRKALWEADICFLMAPRHHSAMRNVAAVRSELGTRTLFNIIGPLTNPALAKRQLMGVYDVAWIEPLAHALARLGTVAAWVVHGSDGLDELTVTGPSAVAALRDGVVTRFEIDPLEVGLKIHPPAALKGGDARTNAEALRALLSGSQGAYRDIVLLNAAGALVVADKVATLPEGIAWARHVIDNGSAQGVLERLVEITNERI
ncbi:MAG: anthranilate phosphoribosyltransferase [Azospirillaceae bacterium]|nr:anthranilate phosphoribosyltransferase [Azospirillaceae bacterium]